MAPGGGVLLIVELLESYAAKACCWSAVKRLCAGSDKACATLPALLFDMMSSMYHRECMVMQADAERCALGQKLDAALRPQLASCNTLALQNLHATFCPSGRTTGPPDYART